MTFHIFWSRRDPSGRLRSDLGEQIADLSGAVRSIIQQKHVPYLCLDMTAMEELETNDPNLAFAELITSLQERGAIVERSDTFWAERFQHSVQWDARQGTVIEQTKELSESLDTSMSSEETVLKYFDPRTFPLPDELVPLCNLYDRHILRQKVIIQLSLTADARTKTQCSSGDAATGGVDQLHLWYLKHQSESGTEASWYLESAKAVEVVGDDIVMISDDEDAEGTSRREEEDHLTPPMDLNLGAPDYKSTWIAGAEIKNKSPVRCSVAQPCTLQHLCLRCRAAETRKKYDQWALTDQRMAAHLILHKRTRKWKPLRTETIWDYLMDLDENLMKRPSLQKVLSHFGALRITSEVFGSVVTAER